MLIIDVNALSINKWGIYLSMQPKIYEIDCNLFEFKQKRVYMFLDCVKKK